MGGDKGGVQPTFVGPHEGREFELMLAGKKHLSSFFLEEGLERDQVFPESQFDAAVAEGVFVKDVRIIETISPDGDRQIAIRSTLYATTDEVWRIPAMRMIQDIYERMGPGWRPDLERAIGALLGYDNNDVELFIE
ncbi:MAG: hypothetical protein JSS22_14905, partial [Proteobacteria bacterium]|nr:hypothetical protein [Pseudomonadota bacterium]